jgi:hypothetical protein
MASLSCKSILTSGPHPSCNRLATSHNAIWAGFANFTSPKSQLLIDCPLDLPPVKPSAIALGTAFNHAVSLAVLGPVFGDAYRRAQQANSKEEYFHSKEAATAAASWGSSIVGSAVQTYGVGALINATGTLTYKGAAYLGSLIFMASAAPSVCHLCLLQPPAAMLTPLRSSPKSSPRSVLSTPSLLAPLPVSSRPSASACSSPTGEPAPTPSTKRLVFKSV